MTDTRPIVGFLGGAFLGAALDPNCMGWVIGGAVGALLGWLASRKSPPQVTEKEVFVLPLLIYVVCRSYSCEGDDVLGVSFDRQGAKEMAEEYSDGIDAISVYACTPETNLVEDISRELLNG